MQCETLDEWVQFVEQKFDISVEDDVLDEVDYMSLNQRLQTYIANSNIQSLYEFVAIFGAAKCIKYTQTQKVEGIQHSHSRTITQCWVFCLADTWGITLKLVTVCMAGCDYMWFNLHVDHINSNTTHT